MSEIWVPTLQLPDGDDEDEHVKTTFAHYGLAMYHAEVLGHGLVNALAVTKIIEARDQAEVLIRDPWAQGFKKTMEKLITHVSQQTAADQQLIDDLNECRARRNHLAHAFWRDHAEEFCSYAGRNSMIEKLESDDALFVGTDKRLAEVMDPLHGQLGISEDLFSATFSKLYREAKGR
ncbi:hypothetical protein AB0O91_24750 [Kitasatospora sp. NPDC089797]|uniref:hypothetical protein n=1 Tax=Kitasatospora sp. NPDC089797 TaxID=3155298 RepID=UPI00343558DE